MRGGSEMFRSYTRGTHAVNLTKLVIMYDTPRSNRIDDEPRLSFDVFSFG